MKKTQAIVTTILAASVAMSCHHNHHQKKTDREKIEDWNGGAGNSFVSTNGGQSYNQTSNGIPFWFWYYVLLNHSGGYGYYPQAVYYPHYYGGSYSGGGMHYSAAGKSYSVGHNVSRGGFGSIGRGVGG